MEDGRICIENASLYEEKTFIISFFAKRIAGEWLRGRDEEWERERKRERKSERENYCR